MAIRSMTGFARADGHDDACGWTWELKSVNGRGLDVRCRLPQDLDGLEPAARMRIRDRFARGTITAALSLTRPLKGGRLRLNPDIADQLGEVLRELAARVDAAPPRLDGLLALRGLIETVEETDSAEIRTAREAAMTATLDEALAALVHTRTEEGARLVPVLTGQLDEIERLAAAAAASASLQPEALRRRLAEQVAALIGASGSLPGDRLAQEAALLAARGDIREEVDRLCAHAAAARELIAADGPVGRRLDFLCQELNREANTLCSKASDIALTRIGLDLKAVIDQLREQIQNLE